MPTLVTIAPGHQLAPAPAASALRMFAAGCPAVITSSYRSSERQQELRDAYLAGNGAFALPPGQSLHERGEAVDWKAAAAAWVREHPEYGWRFTNPDEWWHTDYILALDRTVHTLTPPAPITPEDDMPLTESDMALVRRAIRDEVRTVLGLGGANMSMPDLVAQTKSAAGRAQTARDEIKLHREAAQKGQE